MKTRLLIIIGIVSVAVLVYFLFYAGIIGGSCVEGKNLDGTCAEPKKIIVSLRSNWDFSEQEKSQILIQLRKDPQNVNGTAKQFLVSEAFADQRVLDLLKDTKYQVNCCTYTLDGNEYPYPLYVIITFQLNEKDMYVTVEYDLQQEKIIGVETQEGIRSGGIISFDSEPESKHYLYAQKENLENTKPEFRDEQWQKEMNEVLRQIEEMESRAEPIRTAPP